MGFRWALYSSNSSWRKVFSRESQATITAAGRYSVRILMIIRQKP